MYIGPWQQYKLAKILAMKTKFQKQEKLQNQRMQSQTAPSSTMMIKTNSPNEQTKFQFPPLPKRNNNNSHTPSQYYAKDSFQNRQSFGGGSGTVFSQGAAGVTTSQYNNQPQRHDPAINNYMHTKNIRYNSSKKVPLPRQSSNNRLQMKKNQASIGDNHREKSSRGSSRAVAAQRAQRTTTLSNKSSGMTGAIDEHYKKWRNFNHALEYGSKIQLKERLKDFEPPKIQKYFAKEVIQVMRPSNKPPIIPKILDTKQDAIRFQRLRNQKIQMKRKVFGIQTSSSSSKPQQIIDTVNRSEQVRRDEIAASNYNNILSQKQVGYSRRNNSTKTPSKLFQKINEDYDNNNNRVNYNFNNNVYQHQGSKLQLPAIQRQKPKQQTNKNNGLYSYYYKNYMNRKKQQESKKMNQEYQQRLSGKQSPQKALSVVPDEVDKIVQWAKNLPDLESSAGGEDFSEKQMR